MLTYLNIGREVPFGKLILAIYTFEVHIVNSHCLSETTLSVEAIVLV